MSQYAVCANGHRTLNPHPATCSADGCTRRLRDTPSEPKDTGDLRDQPTPVLRGRAAGLKLGVPNHDGQSADRQAEERAILLNVLEADPETEYLLQQPLDVLRRIGAACALGVDPPEDEAEERVELLAAMRVAAPEEEKDGGDVGDEGKGGAGWASFRPGR